MINTLNFVMLTDILLTDNTDIRLTDDISLNKKNCTSDDLSSARG